MNQQKPVYTHEHKSATRSEEQPNFLRRRIFAGAVALSLVPVLYAGVKSGKQVYDNAQTARFSQFHLNDEASSKFFRINKDNVISYTINKDDVNPTQVAKDLGAKDPLRVSEEISGQVGGDQSMEFGETIILPKNQLNSYDGSNSINNSGQIGADAGVPDKIQINPRGPRH